ncbi:14353_t:CDS:2 [Acaulospora colombiana]|uniref:14353_t:CDS:1 n=1 Tax=Acaulospora colombiana TaxID=27376 RepID=A0ACA9LJR3_9GLOM|nr:14353_t:CDS:2 [Acaulospora colombiana]
MLALFRYQRLMYPEGCGYRSETGGLMEALRKLNVETIRKYHADYYRPDNLCLIITGKLDLDALLKVLEPLDERIAAKGALPPHPRPFVDSLPVPPLEKSIQEVVEFPDEDETEELEDLTKEVFEVMERIVKEDGIDMERMKIVISRDRLKTLNEIENNPHNIYSEACIIDHMYGKEDCSDLEKAVKDLRYYDEIMNFSEEKWIEYLKRFYIDQPHVAILGHPSSEFAKKLYADEKQRIEEQCKTLGPQKLEELDRKLKDAKLANEVPIPDEIIGKCLREAIIDHTVIF